MTRAVVRHSTEAASTPAIDMSTRLGSVGLPSPVLTASGCAAAGRELDQFFDITSIGAIVTKSIMLEPRSGRATPRMAETPSGMLNSIGLQGPGIHAFLEKDLAWLRERGARVMVSIAGGTTQEFEEIAKILREHGGFDALEVNISCPNVADRGQVFACRADTAAAVIGGVRRSTDPSIPVFAKLSPDVTDIGTIALACIRAGADGLSLINTTLGMVIDVDTMRPALAGVTGGLSGRPSGLSLSAACGRCAMSSRTFPSSAWVGSAMAPMLSSSSWRARTPSPSAPSSSTTRRRRRACTPNSRLSPPSAASPACGTRSPTRTAKRPAARRHGRRRSPSRSGCEPGPYRRRPGCT